MLKEKLLEKYKILKAEMKERNLRISSDTPLDVALFRKAMLGIDVPSLGDIVEVVDYVNLNGSFADDPKKADDIDVIIREDEENRDEDLELKLGRILSKQTDKDIEFLYRPKGPHATYIPAFDKILRAKSETKRVRVKENYNRIKKSELPIRYIYNRGEDRIEVIKADKIEKKNKLKLILIGTGALNSPRKDESFLVEHGDEKILIDAGPDIKTKEFSKLTGILVCDPKSDFMKDAKRIGEKFGLIPQVKKIERDGLKIEPFEVKHTNHKTYGYTIKVDNKKIIYAPEFFEFPEKEIKGADLAILEGSAWDRPIRFIGGVGGHAALLDIWEKCKKLKVPVVFTHIGKSVEKHLKEAEEMGIKIGKDGQEITSFEKAKKLTLGKPFTPLKTAGGYGKLEFSNIDALWKFWAKGYIPEPGIAVETKFDGFRVTIHKDGDIKILSEDAKRNLSKQLPDLKSEIKAIKESVILDGELLLYKDRKKIDRKDMPTFLSPRYEDKFTAKIACFDCLWYGSEDLHEKEWQERQKYLDKAFGGLDEKYLMRVKPTIAKSEEQFKTAVKKHSGEAYSEGAMLKSVTSKYPLTGSTSAWAKFKNLKEIRCRVVDKETKEGGGYIYTCEIENKTPIGKTYSTKIKAEKGDVLEVVVAEIKYDEEKDKFTWDNPIVRSLKPKGISLTTIEQAKALAKLKRTRKIEKGNIDFEEGDKGTGILQAHLMGITEEEIENVKKNRKRIFDARHNLKQLEAILNEVARGHAIHLDIRMLRKSDSAWRGGEIHIGNIKGLEKIYNYKEGQKLRANWKSPHKGESKNKEALVIGGMSWFKAGEKSVEIFNPGEPGATADRYGIMVQIDKYDFECLQQDAHAKKFIYTSKTPLKFFDGTWLFAYVPVTAAGKKGERVWMASKLKEEVEKLDLEAFRSEGIDDDLRNPTKRWGQCLADLRYLFNSGYPKLKKGEEWGEWDLMTILKYGAKIIDTLRSKCYFTLVPPKMGDKKYKTSYWEAYREAKKYMKTNPPSEEEVKEWDKKRKKILKEDGFKKFVPIFDVSKKEDEHIVCGIVYAPNEVDSQGDFTTEEEIRKAAYQFMEEVQKFKINHEGDYIRAKVLESYVAPEDLMIADQKVKKGSWILATRILDEDLWRRIKKGEIKGYSMAGKARGEYVA